MLTQILATSYYTSGYVSTSSASSGDILGIFFGLLAAMLLPLLIIVVVSVIGMWKLFIKAGRPGWAAIIPFYNQYVLTEISGQNGLLFLLIFIPGVGAVIWQVMVALKLAPAFGKDTGYAVGLILIPPVFYCILGFGSAQYQLGNSQPNANTQPDAGAKPSTETTPEQTPPAQA